MHDGSKNVKEGNENSNKNFMVAGGGELGLLFCPLRESFCESNTQYIFLSMIMIAAHVRIHREGETRLQELSS
jgi:hypothetical protein